MASKTYYKKNLKTSTEVFEVFQTVNESEEGDYKSNIAKKLDKGQNVNRIVSALFEEGLLEKGKRTKAQYYVVDPEGLSELFCDIWNVSPDLPGEEFQSFLHRYVELYDKGDSSIRKMLREDFAEAAVSYHREHESWPEGLEFLDEVPGLEGFVPVKDYFERAVEDVFER